MVFSLFQSINPLALRASRYFFMVLVTKPQALQRAALEGWHFPVSRSWKARRTMRRSFSPLGKSVLMMVERLMKESCIPLYKSRLDQSQGLSSVVSMIDPIHWAKMESMKRSEPPATPENNYNMVDYDFHLLPSAERF